MTQGVAGWRRVAVSWRKGATRGDGAAKGGERPVLGECAAIGAWEQQAPHAAVTSRTDPARARRAILPEMISRRTSAFCKTRVPRILQ